MKIKVWTYSEGDEFPIRRSSFLRRHWKAFLIAFLAIILAATAWSSIAASSASQPSFTPDSPYVYDGADVLDSSIADTLTQLNETLESQAEGAQLYVVTIDSLPLGQTLEDYSIEQAQRIGAGDSEKDNGVLYTFVKNTRQDRLEVGYGLEDRLTDSVCSKILDSAHGYYRDGDIKAGVKDLARDVANVIQPGIDGGTPFVPPVRHEFPEKEESILSKIASVFWLYFTLPSTWHVHTTETTSRLPARIVRTPRLPNTPTARRTVSREGLERGPHRS